jgi:hypothetical protein
MNPLTKMALGLIGQLRPEPPTGDGSPVLALPPPRQGGGLPLMQALARRQSQREFDPVACRCRCCRTCCGLQRASTGPTVVGAPRPAP